MPIQTPLWHVPSVLQFIHLQDSVENKTYMRCGEDYIWFYTQVLKRVAFTVSSYYCHFSMKVKWDDVLWPQDRSPGLNASEFRSVLCLSKRSTRSFRNMGESATPCLSVGSLLCDIQRLFPKSLAFWGTMKKTFGATKLKPVTFQSETSLLKERGVKGTAIKGMIYWLSGNMLSHRAIIRLKTKSWGTAVNSPETLAIGMKRSVHLRPAKRGPPWGLLLS